MSQLFICRDIYVDPVLDEVAATLAAAGHHVVRGPKVTPGVKMEFAPEAYPDYFAGSEIIVVTSRNLCPRAVMAAAPRLRAVIAPTIGVDAIDLAAADDLGVIVGHGAMPENFLSMGEATVMLITTLFYNLHASERVLREGAPRPETMHARMVLGSTIGFVGFGRIARAAAERLQGWGARLLVHDPFLTAADVPAEVTLVDLPTLMRESDLVSLHVTLSKDTHHLVGETEIRLMKPGSFLVNTARGGVVDDRALTRAITDGHLAGAALDTFEDEPLPKDSPLRGLANVILTPHMVGHTREILTAMPKVLLTNIERVLAGQAPLYTKNPATLPRWHERLARLAAIGGTA